MVKCIFKPNEYLYVDLSTLESCSNTECSIWEMHLGPDQNWFFVVFFFLTGSNGRSFLKCERWSCSVKLRAVLKLDSSVLMTSV